MRSNTARLLVRNVSHLGIGQVASTAFGVLLNAVIGRALEPAQLGIFYIALAISSFVSVIIDWGQSAYLVREMARGRIDEPELIGSALLVRLATIVFSFAVAVAVAVALGYDGHIVELTLLAIVAAIPATLYVPFGCSFRGKDRMDIDAFVNIVGKAMTLVVTIIALRLGGGLTAVILMQGVGGLATLVGRDDYCSAFECCCQSACDQGASGNRLAWSADRCLLACDSITALCRDIAAFCAHNSRSRGMVWCVPHHTWALLFPRR